MSLSDSPSRRNKKQTKERLINAVIEIIRERGYEEVGVNAVAERAGVSKVLIYRYFGDLGGLYEAAAERLDPLQARAAQRLFEQLEGEESPDADGSEAVRSLARRTILDLHMALREDELTKNLLIWELSNQNSITEALSKARERTGLELTERFRRSLGGAGGREEFDVNALLALVTAGVFYLTLRSDAVSDFNGIDIRSDEGWERIADAVADLVARGETGARRGTE